MIVVIAELVCGETGEHMQKLSVTPENPDIHSLFLTVEREKRLIARNTLAKHVFDTLTRKGADKNPFNAAVSALHEALKAPSFGGHDLDIELADIVRTGKLREQLVLDSEKPLATYLQTFYITFIKASCAR